jgi:predicted RNA-binding Zn-ribbon protein involved in translation (DUF1610 family)
MASKEQICPNCGFKGAPKKITKGTILIEIVLWLFLIIPGICYTLWRMTSRVLACPQCKSVGMVALDSPRGKKLVEEYYPAT